MGSLGETQTRLPIIFFAKFTTSIIGESRRIFKFLGGLYGRKEG